MTQLNDHPFTIVLRQGTEANLMLATTYLTQGELAYTTDTGRVFVSDGTNRLPVSAGTPVIVSALPSAATSGVGAKGFVTDALAPVFGSAVAGLGAVPVPVYSDGANWIVG